MFRYSSGVRGCGRTDMALALGTRASWHEVARRVAHFSPILMAPKSTGRVSLSIELKPVIEYQLLADYRDQVRLADGFQRAAELIFSPAVAALIGLPVATSRSANMGRFALRTRRNIFSANVVAAMMDWIPGVGDRVLSSLRDTDVPLVDLSHDQNSLADYIRRNVGPLAHHAGTCRMGDDKDAVVDSDGRVHGVGGLRVADASIMPTVPRANTNLPTLMIAEKISHSILKQANKSTPHAYAYEGLD